MGLGQNFILVLSHSFILELSLGNLQLIFLKKLLFRLQLVVVYVMIINGLKKLPKTVGEFNS